MIVFTPSCPSSTTFSCPLIKVASSTYSTPLGITSVSVSSVWLTDTSWIVSLLATVSPLAEIWSYSPGIYPASTSASLTSAFVTVTTSSDSPTLIVTRLPRLITIFSLSSTGFSVETLILSVSEIFTPCSSRAPSTLSLLVFTVFVSFVPANSFISVIVISFADALYTVPNITVIIATSVIIAIAHLLCFAFNFAFFFSSRFSRKFINISCFVISCVVIKVKPLSLLVP